MSSQGLKLLVLWSLVFTYHAAASSFIMDTTVTINGLPGSWQNSGGASFVPVGNNLLVTWQTYDMYLVSSLSYTVVAGPLQPFGFISSVISCKDGTALVLFANGIQPSINKIQVNPSNFTFLNPSTSGWILNLTVPPAAILRFLAIDPSRDFLLVGSIESMAFSPATQTIYSMYLSDFLRPPRASSFNFLSDLGEATVTQDSLIFLNHEAPNTLPNTGNGTLLRVPLAALVLDQPLATPPLASQSIPQFSCYYMYPDTSGYFMYCNDVDISQPANWYTLHQVFLGGFAPTLETGRAIAPSVAATSAPQNGVAAWTPSSSSSPMTLLFSTLGSSANQVLSMTWFDSSLSASMSNTPAVSFSIPWPTPPLQLTWPQAAVIIPVQAQSYAWLVTVIEPNYNFQTYYTQIAVFNTTLIGSAPVLISNATLPSPTTIPCRATSLLPTTNSAYFIICPSSFDVFRVSVVTQPNGVPLPGTVTSAPSSIYNAIGLNPTILASSVDPSTQDLLLLVALQPPNLLNTTMALLRVVRLLSTDMSLVGMSPVVTLTISYWIGYAWPPTATIAAVAIQNGVIRGRFAVNQNVVVLDFNATTYLPIANRTLQWQSPSIPYGINGRYDVQTDCLVGIDTQNVNIIRFCFSEMDLYSGVPTWYTFPFQNQLCNSVYGMSCSLVIPTATPILTIPTTGERFLYFFMSTGGDFHLWPLRVDLDAPFYITNMFMNLTNYAVVASDSSNNIFLAPYAQANSLQPTYQISPQLTLLQTIQLPGISLQAITSADKSLVTFFNNAFQVTPLWLACPPGWYDTAPYDDSSSSDLAFKCQAAPIGKYIVSSLSPSSFPIPCPAFTYCPIGSYTPLPPLPSNSLTWNPVQDTDADQILTTTVTSVNMTYIIAGSILISVAIFALAVFTILDPKDKKPSHINEDGGVGDDEEIHHIHNNNINDNKESINGQEQGSKYQNEEGEQEAGDQDRFNRPTKMDSPFITASAPPFHDVESSSSSSSSHHHQSSSSAGCCGCWTSTRKHRLAAFLSRHDAFSSHHATPLGKTPVVRKTPLGGVVTLFCLTAVLVLLYVTVHEYRFNNTLSQVRIIPLAANDALPTTFAFFADIYGITPRACRYGAALFTTPSSMNAISNILPLVNSNGVEQGCTLVVQINAYAISGGQSLNILYSAPDPTATAAYINFNVSAFQNAQLGINNMYKREASPLVSAGSVIAPVNGSVLRGPQSTQTQMSFRTVLKSRSGVPVGSYITPQGMDVNIGSFTQNMYLVGDSNIGVHLEFSIQLDASMTQIDISPKLSILQSLSIFFAQAGTVIAIGRFSLPSLEKMLAAHYSANVQRVRNARRKYIACLSGLLASLFCCCFMCCSTSSPHGHNNNNISSPVSTVPRSKQDSLSQLRTPLTA